jgi:lipopolysaccharide exporter
MIEKRKYGYWLNAGLYSSLQKASVLAFGIISTVLLTRFLGGGDRHQMGIWSLFLTIAGLIEVVRHGLIKNAVIKYINSSSRDEHTHILSAALWLNIVITSIIGVSLLGCAHLLSKALNAPDLESVLYIFSIGLLALIPFSHFEWVQNANSEFKGVFYAYFARQIFALVLIVVSIFFKSLSLNLLVLYYSLGIVVGAFVSYRFARKMLSGKFVINRAWVSKVWHFGKYVFGTNVSSAIFRSTDQFCVSYFLLPSVVALQSISLRVTNLTDIPSQVLGDILFPKSAQSVNDGNQGRIKFLYEKSVGAVLAFVLPTTVFILLFPKFILILLAGRGYAQAAPYLRVVILAGLFMPFLKQFGTIMDSTGKPGINFLIMALVAILHLCNCYFFIKNQFLIGAGIALIITQFIAFVITQNLLRKYYRINFLNCFKYAFDFYPEILQLLQNRFSAKWQKA